MGSINLSQIRQALALLKKRIGCVTPAESIIFPRGDVASRSASEEATIPLAAADAFHTWEIYLFA